MLYRSRNGSRVRVELVFVASAPGYETSSASQLNASNDGYYRRKLDFALWPTGRTEEADAEDVADVTAKEVLATGDPNKRFFLIGRKGADVPVTNGCALLLVLPGGDGGPDFLSFVKRICQNALPNDYLAAELIAPRWDEKQAEQIVWPTEMTPYPGMKFSTEVFIHSVIREIEKQHRLDPRRIFTLSWSSSGPAGYAASLYTRTRVTGSLIAMSVFQPQRLPDLKAARGRAYFLLHSPEDPLVPVAMANGARDLLTANGANVKLVNYEGGHGWQGDVYGHINAGLRWLEDRTDNTYSNSAAKTESESN